VLKVFVVARGSRVEDEEAKIEGKLGEGEGIEDRLITVSKRWCMHQISHGCVQSLHVFHFLRESTRSSIDARERADSALCISEPKNEVVTPGVKRM